MPGKPGHLTRRFFDVWAASPLTEAEHLELHGWLSEPELRLFEQQPIPDQRHGYEAGRSIVEQGYDDQEVIVAAVLHDVGKRHSRLGALGRSLASVLIILHATWLWRRARTYRDHGEIAARELDALGCPPLIVEFARHHHGSRPPVVDRRLWDALKLADEPAKDPARRWRPII